MNLLKLIKIKDAFRIRFASVILIIALLLIIGTFILINYFKQECVILWTKFIWCLAFTIFGFCLLILKICINRVEVLVNNKEEMEEEKKKYTKYEGLDKIKIQSRYFLIYPILILVLATLSTSLSITKFSNLEEIQGLIASALLSFFLGFFIDSIPNVIEKVGKTFSS